MTTMSWRITQARVERPTVPTPRRRRGGSGLALGLAATLVVGLVQPVVLSTAAVAATQDIGAVATAFRLSGVTAANNVKIDWTTVDGAMTYELSRALGLPRCRDTAGCHGSVTICDVMVL